MKAAIAIFVVLTLTACEKPAEESVAAGVEFQVDRLFTVDGCTVYRFRDSGTRYFTNCQGETQWDESYQCGKAQCKRSHSISGSAGSQQ